MIIFRDAYIIWNFILVSVKIKNYVFGYQTTTDYEELKEELWRAGHMCYELPILWKNPV